MKRPLQDQIEESTPRIQHKYMYSIFYNNNVMGRSSKILRCGNGVKVSQYCFKSARTDDASFSNVCALADASSCKAANKSTI